MYTSYFGFTDKPFAIAPNPRYLYMSQHHREALAHLLYGISSDDGCFILLTGDVGTGKTTICRSLLEQLPEKTDIAIILNPKLTTNDLLQTICEELEIAIAGDSSEGSTSPQTYIDRLNSHLLCSHGEGRTTALIIDEAQNLDPSVIEQLRLLTNLETTTHKLLRIILIGQPELRTILNRPELSQINQRITGRYHLTPLPAADVRAYIQHRLGVAGNDTAGIFSEKAIDHVIKKTGGIPRLINIVCDRALLGAYAEEVDHVDLDIVKRAGQEVFPQAGKIRLLSGWDYLFAAIFLLLLISISIAYIRPTFKPASQRDTTLESGTIPAGPGTSSQIENEVIVEPPSAQADQPGQEQPQQEPRSRITITPPVQLSGKSEQLLTLPPEAAGQPQQ